MSTLYWITVLGNLSGLAAILLVIVIVCAALNGFQILLISSHIMDEHDKTSINKAINRGRS